MFTDNPKYIIPEDNSFIEVYETYDEYFLYVKLKILNNKENLNVIQYLYCEFYYKAIDIVIDYNGRHIYNIDDVYLDNDTYYICFYIKNDFDEIDSISAFLTSNNLEIDFLKSSWYSGFVLECIKISKK